MRTINRRRRYWAWLAVFALLGSVLIPPHLRPLTAGKSALADQVLGLLVICSAHGGQPASGDGGGSGDPQFPDQCLMCSALTPVSLAIALLLLMLLVPLRSLRLLRSGFERSPAIYLGLGSLHSRAPPLSA